MKISVLQEALDYHKGHLGDVEVAFLDAEGDIRSVTEESIRPVTVVCVDASQKPPVLLLT